MKRGEKPKDAARRGLTEGLSTIEGIERQKLKSSGRRNQALSSPSYPGLASRYRMFRFSTQLTSEQFRQEEYMSYEANKTTYFVWIRLK